MILFHFSLLLTEKNCDVSLGFAVEGGAEDPCPAKDGFQLGSGSDPSCTQKCKSGYTQKGGSPGSRVRSATVECDSNGDIHFKPAELFCVGTSIYIHTSSVCGV